MVKALVLSGHDLDAWTRDYERGAAPAALPYEVDALRSTGIDLVVRSNVASPTVDRLRKKVEHRTGYDVALGLRGLVPAASVDVVIAVLERGGAFPSILRRRGIPPYSRKPLVIWSCWLADDVLQASPAERERLRRRYAGADLITHLSRHETSVLTEAGFAEDRLFPVTYGVSDRYYSPGDEGDRDIDLLAVGQDRGRDYATLFAAIEGTDLTLDLVCRPENLVGLEVPANVRMHGTVPIDEYRRMLRRAKVMAVPTKVLSYPTGSSVALEAASSGCCVVATDTPAMSDYIGHERSGLLVPPGDVARWRQTLHELRRDDDRRRALGHGARHSVEEQFNATHMWHGLAAVMRERGLIRD